MRRAVTALLLAVFALLITSGTASAHNVLIGSDPARDATLAVAPTQAKLTFDQPIQQGQGFNAMTLTGPGGTRWPVTGITVDSTVISGRIPPLGPAGVYTIGYRILSADGHPVTGAIRFTVTNPGTGTPAPAGTGDSGASGSGGSIPIWIWIVAAAVLLAVGVFGALRLGSAESSRT